MTEDSGASPKRRSSAWYLLLLVPFIGVLFPGFYNSLTPTLAGLPRFYWYQLTWVVITSVLTAVVYLVMR
ncbi:MAG: DUF3311 domain-containing protein [Peptococcaceae bacterium]|nr:DUF3311 domain-containing protein [Peptococcaceae bacterium]